MGEVTFCGLCHRTGLTTLLDLGSQPLAERHDDPNSYPLTLMQCPWCSLVQLSYIVDQREVFPPDHPYTTGTTSVLREHFAELAAELAEFTHQGDMVADIGANDGTLLLSYPVDGLILVAVEPTNQARKCADWGAATYQEFFTAELAERIVRTYGPAKVVTATNVLAHVPDPHDFTDGIATLLADDGLFVTENHDVASITEGLQIDTIYHEHLRYYSVASLGQLLAVHGLGVTAARPVDIHGGSFRVYARKRHAGELADRAGATVAELHSLLIRLTSSGHKVYGVGATTRATPLIHYAKIGPFIDYVCEIAGSEKIGLMMPGTGIPIVDERLLIDDQPEYALLFAWHIAEDLIEKLRRQRYRGKFVIPLPKPRVVV